MNGGHYLKKAKGQALPGQAMVIGWVDAQAKREGTDQVYQTQFVAGHYIRWRMRDGEQLCRFDGRLAAAGEFLAQLERQALDGSLTWVFTLGLRQLLAVAGFWDWVLKGRIDLWGEDRGRPQVSQVKGRRPWKGYAILENPPSIVCCRFRPRGGAVKLVDVANYNINDWAQMGEQLPEVNGHGLEVNFDFQPPGEEAADRAAGLERFCLDAWHMCRWANFGTWQSTAASQAAVTYRHRFLTHDILCHQNQDARLLERESIYGGRCECFYLGKVEQHQGLYPQPGPVDFSGPAATVNGPIYHLDVNSMYPFLAQDCMLPARLDYFEDYPRLGEMAWDELGSDCVADVTVKTDVPCLPFRRDDELIFPVGTFRTVLPGPELMLARCHAKLVKVHRLARYHMEPLFQGWGDCFWELRREFKGLRNQALVNWFKAISTSVFGKFAQRSKRWVECPGVAAMEPFDLWYQKRKDGEGVDEYRAIAWEVSRLETVGEHPQAVPAITSWVNSLGRVYLWHLMETAGMGNVFYVNTDSLWTPGAGLAALNQAGRFAPDRLGGLKQVGAYNTVEFLGIMHYVADGWRVCAGIPPGPADRASFPCEVRQAVNINADLWRHQAPSADSVAQALDPRRAYRHGQVDRHGQVYPIQLSHLA